MRKIHSIFYFTLSMALFFSFIVVTPTESQAYSGIPTYVYETTINLNSQHIRAYACKNFSNK